MADFVNRENLAIHHLDQSGNIVFVNPDDGQFHTNTGEQTGALTSNPQPVPTAEEAAQYFQQPGRRPLDRFTNTYPNEYKTGSQVSVFFGPIYIEEIIHIQWTTASNTTPIYGMDSRFWNTLVDGNHMIQGQFAIAYSETDYIWRQLKEYEFLQETDVRQVTDIISRGRNKYLSRLIDYRRRQNPDEDIIVDDKGARSRSIEDITRYVDFIINRRILDLEHNSGLFNIAIVAGDYREKDFALRSFVDCKIIGTGQTIQADDNHLVEVYNFIARVQQLPPRQKKIVEIKGIQIEADPAIVLADFEKALREIAKTLEIWPSLESNGTDRYIPGVLDSVDHIAIIGLPNEGTGIYGHDVHIIEPYWELYYDQVVPLPEPPIRVNAEVDTDTIKLFDEDKVIRDTQNNSAVIINDGLLWVTAEENLPYINAISNVIGSREIGAGIPPMKIPLSNFRWHDYLNKHITSSILWTSLISNEQGYWVKYPRRTI